MIYIRRSATELFTPYSIRNRIGVLGSPFPCCIFLLVSAFGQGPLHTDYLPPAHAEIVDTYLARLGLTLVTTSPGFHFRADACDARVFQLKKNRKITNYI